jgi:hypothetical protein
VQVLSTAGPELDELAEAPKVDRPPRWILSAPAVFLQLPGPDLPCARALARIAPPPAACGTVVVSGRRVRLRGSTEK